jgi:ATP-dependent Lon protease
MSKETTTERQGERSFSVPREVPVLPLRDTVLFPNSFMPLAVARESSVTLIDDAIATATVIGVFTQKDPAQEEPGEGDLHEVGTLTHIHKMFKLPDGSLRLIVQGLTRLRLERITATRPYLRAEVSELHDERDESEALQIDALERNIRANFAQVVQLSPVLSEDLTALASNISDVSRC